MKNLTQILESLCTRHKGIRHKQTEKHFAAQGDEVNTSIDSLLHYPAVFLLPEQARIAGEADAYTLRRTYKLSVVEHARDTGDYADVERIFARTEVLLMDLLNTLESLKRTEKALRGFSLSGTTIDPVENEADSLFGHLATFSMDEAYSTCLPEEIYDSEEQQP